MTASTDLTHKLTAIVEQLAQETDAARLSAAFSQFVETADQIITALELPPHPSMEGEGWGGVPAQDR